MKGSAGFWFDRVSYERRMQAAAALMFLGFLGVGPLSFGRLAPQLVGVMLCSAQSSLGEASLLALASRHPRNGADAVAAWSSGTGLAGVFGYAWVAGLTRFLGLRVETAIALAMVSLPFAYYASYFALLREKAKPESGAATAALVPQALALTARARLAFALSLWPVTGAIVAVYFSEYAMQSGVWAAMGFPNPQNPEKRDAFYEYANWMYQCGVLVSRSSALVCGGAVRKRALWAMALAQCGMLAFFALDAAFHWWYDSSILALCFVVGLFGGAVYVHGFRLLAATGDRAKRELAMTVGAFSSDCGTLLSNVVGLALQGCLYEANDIEGATIPVGWCSK
ncbi:batten's disease protein Cln3 [Pelagophyceae sp. CCMP2097]|nr:batten's disease protein Cln3 [Pelagophyceae sp. CCMP2097]